MLRFIASGAVLAALTIAGSQAPPGTSGPAGRTPPTFTKDIAPILFANCAGCHRPGQVAPFSVLQYAALKPHVKQIAAATARRSMPPWPPEHGYGDFRDEHRLRDDQIDTIQRWVAAGAIEGDPRDLPPAPVLDGESPLGQADLTVALPEPYGLRSSGADVFRNFVIPVSIGSTQYVRGLEFHPGNAKVVHHATIFVDPVRSSRRLDAADPAPGYEGMLGVGEGVYVPDGQFLGWTPGRAPFMQPDGMAWRLDPGTDLVVQLHMVPSGKAELIQPSVSLFFTETPPARAIPAVRFRMGSRTIDIPAGERNYQITDSYVLPVDVELLSVNPHAHNLAREMKAYATLPDGARQWLIWIRNWDFNWQNVYQYATPMALPRGTRLTMEYTYDNSAANRRNPHRPPARVVYGPQSSDEMGDLWLQLLARDRADRLVLVKEDRDRSDRAAVAEAQQMLRIAPDAEKHNLLAVRYLAVGRIEEARAELAEAIRLKPDYAKAHSNLGTILETEGRIAEAIAQFREAVAGDPGSFDVHLNLGNALNAAGRFAAAADQFQQAITINPASAESHNNLAVALGSLDRIEEAVQQLRRALEISPDYADAHSNLGLALASLGQRGEAMQHYQRALEINPNHPGAREQLRLLREVK